MTATPIPRSLALTVYGDLAMSVIDEMPPRSTPDRDAGRRPGASGTRSTPGVDGRAGEAGAQAYVVCPLIEVSESIDAPVDRGSRGETLRRRSSPPTGSRSCTAESVAEDASEIMRRFAAGEFDVLIATTVIEVGVDVPKATLMVIEGAERFGLAQLHQLRGRVGRGSQRSYCVADPRAR